MKYIAPVASAMGISIEETAAAIGLLSNAGIQGSQSGTVLRGALSRLAKPSKEASDLMKELGFNAYDANGKMLPLNKIIGNLQKSTANLTDAQKQNALVTMFGQESLSGMLALIAAGPEQLVALTEGFENCDGSAKKMADTMQNNLKGKITAFKSALEGAGIAIGENLLPALTGMVEKVTGVVSAFGKLPQSTQKAVVNFGLVAAAIGPVLSIAGKLVTVIGKLMPATSAVAELFGGGLLGGLVSVLGPLSLLGAGFYVVYEAVQVANSGITKSREEMSLTERAIADFTGKVTYSREELENMGLVYKDFADDISPEFRSAVEEMRTDIGDFAIALKEINFDGVVSEEESAELQKRVSDAIDGAKQAIESKKSEVQKTLGETFVADDGVISSGEQAIIDLANKQMDAYNTELAGISTEIQELMRKTIEEGYTLTPADEAKINDYYARIKQIELEAMSNNSTEKLYAMNLFKEQVATLDADAASKLALQKKQEIDTATQEENAMYRTRMQTLNDLYQEANKNHDEALKSQIENEKQQLIESHNASIAEQQRYTEEIYQALIESNANLAMEIDRFTLERFSSQDQAYNQQLLKYIEYNNAVGKATQTGQQFILEQTEQTMTKTVAVVDETTGQMTGAFEVYQEGNNMIIQNVVGYNEKYQESTQTLADKYISSWTTMKNELLNNGIQMIDGNGNLIASNGQVVGSMETVVDANGNVLTSIKDINGNPIVIDENTAEVIKKLIATQQEVDKTDGKKATVTVYADTSSAESSLSWLTRNRTVTVTAVNAGSVKGALPKATGGENLSSGLYEVAEYGPELITGAGGMMLAQGRQLVNMDGGETVYNARQTNEILRNMSDRNSINSTSKIESLLYEVSTKLDRLKEIANNGLDITKAIEEIELSSDIVMDSRKVGEAVFPTINTKLAQGRYRG